MDIVSSYNAAPSVPGPSYVLSPSTGDAFFIGAQQNISWVGFSSPNVGLMPVTIDTQVHLRTLLCNQTAASCVGVSILSISTANNGFYPWTVPSCKTITRLCSL